MSLFVDLLDKDSEMQHAFNALDSSADNLSSRSGQ
jgi:hypothetical protein